MALNPSLSALSKSVLEVAPVVLGVPTWCLTFHLSIHDLHVAGKFIISQSVFAFDKSRGPSMGRRSLFCCWYQLRRAWSSTSFFVVLTLLRLRFLSFSHSSLSFSLWLSHDDRVDLLKSYFLQISLCLVPDSTSSIIANFCFRVLAGCCSLFFLSGRASVVPSSQNNEAFEMIRSKMLNPTAVS